MSKSGAGFSRVINVKGLGREPVTLDIQASQEECSSLANDLGIIGLNDVVMKGVLKRQKKPDWIEVSAQLKAEAVQACVATLEPVSQAVDVDFTLYYTFDKEDVEGVAEDYVVGMEEEDLPELIVNGRINIMDILIEQIALALDPYPRAENAAVDQGVVTAQEQEIPQEVHRPFANLKDLMNKK